MTKPTAWQTHEFRDLDFHVRVCLRSPSWMDYEVRDVVGTDAEGDRLLLASAGGREDDQSHDPDAVAPLIVGSIKWDGCSHNTFTDEGYVPGGGRRDMVRLGALFDRLFDIALALMSTNAEYLR